MGGCADEIMTCPRAKECSMLPSPAEGEAARRVLKAIESRRYSPQSDDLVLRLWAGPRNGERPWLYPPAKSLKRRIERYSPCYDY
jgi:hypothetical protein